MKKTIDLHVHTHYSDGIHSVEKVLSDAKKAGIKAISLTDHNWPDNMAKKVKLAEEFGIESIQGVEISARFEETTVHILGYSRNFDIPKLREGIDKQIKGLENRAIAVIESINNSGVTYIDFDDIKKRYIGSIGNFQITVELAKKIDKPIHSRDTEEIFKKHSLPYGKWHLEPREVVAAIHETGGIAVWAHPALYLRKNGRDKFERLFQLLLELGISGLEAHHSQQIGKDEKMVAEMASGHNLIVTGGSDFHGLAVHPCRPFGSGGVSEEQYLALLKKIDTQ